MNAPAAAPEDVQLRHISYSMRDAALALASEKATTEMSVRQIGILFLLYSQDGTMTVRDVCKALKISKPSISRAISSLDKLKWIERAADPSDRRSVLVGLTGLGFKRVKRLCAIADEASDKWREPAAVDEKPARKPRAKAAAA